MLQVFPACDLYMCVISKHLTNCACIYSLASRSRCQSYTLIILYSSIILELKANLERNLSMRTLIYGILYKIGKPRWNVHALKCPRAETSMRWNVHALGLVCRRTYCIFRRFVRYKVGENVGKVEGHQKILFGWIHSDFRMHQTGWYYRQSAIGQSAKSFSLSI